MALIATPDRNCFCRKTSHFEQNRNWLYLNFSFESSNFIFNNFKTEKFKLTFKG